MRTPFIRNVLMACAVSTSVVVAAQTAGKPAAKAAAPARGAAAGARQVPTPASVLGFEPGTDRKIADTEQLGKYLKALAAAAPDRIKVVEIGKSWEGRPLWMAIITSEANMKNLARYKEISHKLALAKDLTEEEADKLVHEGRTVILIDHGKDGNEPAHGEASLLLAYHMVSSEDEEARMIRDNTILLMTTCINPDGREYMLKWYRQILGTPYEMTGKEPWYDHPMFGHEGNRDLVNLETPEMAALSKVNWNEWNPQIVVDQHQGVPYPARIFMPPFADPFNPSISPLVQRGTNTIGQGMAMRFEREGKSGVISQATYTDWANGGVSDSPYFHNQVGILVETQQRPGRWASPGYTDPASIPDSFGIPTVGPGVVPNAPSVFYPNPWKGGVWNYRMQAEYMYTASMGALAMAAKLRQDWLHNVYQLAKENIEKGKKGDPFAWVVPADQWDAGEAVELVNTLQREAIDVHRATAPFTAGGKSYPAGSYIAFAGQPFRMEMIDVLEPHHHPHMSQYPGGPPIPPYDQATWNVPFGMGVTVDRINEPFTASVEEVTASVVRKGTVTGQGPNYLLSTKENDSFRALNKLWAAGVAVSRATAPFDAAGQNWPAGTFVVQGDAAKLTPIAEATGASFTGAADVSVQTTKVPQPKIGVYQTYYVTDHNPDAGWVRWVLQTYGFEFTTLHDQDMRNGDLSKFTVIVLPDQSAAELLHGIPPGSDPPEYTGGLGADGAANLKHFTEKGGTLVALSAAGDFAIEELELPVRNTAERLPSTQMFIPASYLRAKVDNKQPLGFGMPADAAFLYFRRFMPNQAVYSIVKPADGKSNVTVAARYGDKNLLLSGWEIGADKYLAGTPAAVQVPYGAGNVVLYNFRPQWRGEAHGTYKFLFNSLMLPSGASAPKVTSH